MKKTKLSHDIKKAYGILLLFGFISLMGDISYESARSINGPYLNLLKADAVVIGWIMGLGEFLSYAIRIVSGYVSDKSKAYWFFTILGYSTILAIPLLSLSNTWQIAAILIFIERLGKGLRSPAKDTIISYAAKRVGTGYGFGISELLDQLGAFIGPFLLTIFFYYQRKEIGLPEYQEAYRLLWIPYLLLMLVLIFTYFKFQQPETLEKKGSLELINFQRIFWLYGLFIFLTTMGLINFGILGYHLKVTGIATDYQIPFFYALAMLVDAIIGIVVGKYYDHIKSQYKKENASVILLLIIPILTIISICFLFIVNIFLAFLGILIWGAIVGLHETLMKAVVTDLSSTKNRGTLFGMFHIVYGIAIFLGSTIVGYLYELSLLWLVIVLVGIEILSIFVFLLFKKEIEIS